MLSLDKAAEEMAVRVDQLVPYGYTDTAISTSGDWAEMYSARPAATSRAAARARAEAVLEELRGSFGRGDAEKAFPRVKYKYVRDEPVTLQGWDGYALDIEDAAWRTGQSPLIARVSASRGDAQVGPFYLGFLGLAREGKQARRQQRQTGLHGDRA